MPHKTLQKLTSNSFMQRKLAQIAGVLGTLACAGFFAFAIAYVSPGQPTGFVNDFANIIDDDTQAKLETQLSSYRQTSNHEVVVVTISSLQGDYIENYAVKLFEEWGIGDKEKDNGILLLVASEDKKVRIEVGYGLEGALVDSEASQIIQGYIIPSFKENNYSLGIANGVDQIIKATEGEIVDVSQKKQSVNWEEIIFFIIFGVIFAINVLIQVLASSKSWWLGGVLGGAAGSIITFLGLFGVSLFFGLFITFGFAFLGLLLDYFVSKNSNSILRHFGKGDNWPGGFGGMGGFGGGGSGGFGGFGGGGSGGGGSSGSW